MFELMLKISITSKQGENYREIIHMNYSKEQLDAINNIDGQLCIISVAGSGKTAVIVARAENIVKHGVRPYRILVLTFSKAAAVHMGQRYISEYGNKGIRFSTIHSLCYSVLVRAYNLQADSILSDKDRMKFFTEFHRQLLYKRVVGVSDDFDEFYRKCDEYISLESQNEYYENTHEYLRKCNIKTTDKTSDKTLDKTSDIISDNQMNKITNEIIKSTAAEIYKDNVSGYVNGYDEKMNSREKYSRNDTVYLKLTYEQYKEYKKANKKLDYDDMVIYCHKCLSRKPDELKYWQSVFDYIMVDEFQDTGKLQADIIYMVSDAKKNICVVGDDDQSIYGFRGARGTVFTEFMDRYPDARKIILGTNYRSLPYIIKGADKVIRNNKERIAKEMRAYRSGDGKIHTIRNVSQGKQADKVVSLVNDYAKNGGKLNEIAVLYRVKKEASVLVSTLETIGLPFYTRDMVDDIHLGMCYKDMLAYYRLSRGICENGDLQRIINRPKRYIRANLIRNCEFDRNKIYEACTKGATRQECLRINDTINDMFLDLRTLSKIDNPIQFINYIYDNMGYEESLYEYVEYVGIDKEECMNQSDMMKKESLKLSNMSEWYNYIIDKEYRQRVDKDSGIYLSTFHGAKGLEWKKVIIISANEGITPYVYMGNVDDYEEERRLFYVAMTRAEDELDILYIDGMSNNRQMSRYIEELMMPEIPD